MVVVHSTIPDFSSLSYSFFFSHSNAHAFFLEAFISWWGSHVAWLATHTVVSHCEELHMKCILSLNLSNTTDGFPLLIRLIWCITFVHRYWQSLVVLACLTWSCMCGWPHGYQIYLVVLVFSGCWVFGHWHISRVRAFYLLLFWLQTGMCLCARNLQFFSLGILFPGLCTKFGLKIFFGGIPRKVCLEGHCKRNHANYVILWSCWVSLLSNVVPLEYYAMLWNVGTSALGLVVFI
jgi:hypothetical protein